MSLEQRGKYYVYILAHPSVQPFYIGKGSGHRMMAHIWEARRGCPCDKCRIVRAIWRAGYQVWTSVVFRSDDEDQAFAEEARLIRLFGLTELANQTWGGPGRRVRRPLQRKS